MNTLDDLPEMVELCRDGEASKEFFFGMLVEMLADHDVPLVVDQLPADLAKELVESLRETFDNHAAADGFISFSSASGATPISGDTVRKIRRWLAATFVD